MEKKINRLFLVPKVELIPQIIRASLNLLGLAFFNFCNIAM